MAFFHVPVWRRMRRTALAAGIAILGTFAIVPVQARVISGSVEAVPQQQPVRLQSAPTLRRAWQ
jgi:hypothetical protein